MWIFRKPNKRMFLDWRGYIAGTILVALATLVKHLAQPDIIAVPNSLPYIPAILVAAVYFGFGPAIFASILSVLAYDIFFVAPFGSLTLPGMQDLLNLVIFLLVGVIVSFIASTLRHTSEEAERLATRLIASQEEEKKRIARDLHDDTSPSLASLGLEMDGIMKKHPALPEDVSRRLETARKKVNDIQLNLRQFSHRLHPAILDSLGLEPALESMAAGLVPQKQMEIYFDTTGAGRKLPGEINLALYRIAQEALNNVIKHSRATRVKLSLEYTRNKTILSVTDNGIGFGSSAYTKGSLGLTSMKERANLIGAKLRIESKPGRGTSVIVELEI